MLGGERSYVFKCYSKILYLLFGTFTVIGLVMSVAGICIRVNTGNFAEDAMEITGTISSIERYRDIDGDIHLL